MNRFKVNFALAFDLKIDKHISHEMLCEDISVKIYQTQNYWDYFVH